MDIRLFAGYNASPGWPACSNRGKLGAPVRSNVFNSEGMARPNFEGDSGERKHRGGVPGGGVAGGHTQCPSPTCQYIMSPQNLTCQELINCLTNKNAPILL